MTVFSNEKFMFLLGKDLMYFLCGQKFMRYAESIYFC